MNDSHHVVRNYHSSHFDSYLELRSEAAKLKPFQNYISPQFLRSSLARPNYSPEQDLFLVEMSGKLVGYLDINPERIIGRIILDCFIRPEHRRKGLAGKLLTYAEKRANELGIKVIHISILEKNTIARKTLVKLGFQLNHREHELRLALNEATVRESSTSFAIRHLQPGEEDKLTVVQNRSFTGSWGYNPNTEEEIRYATSTGAYTPEEILLACDGDKPVAYCWTGVAYKEGVDMNESTGYITMIGVDPDYRGIGMGKAVLMAGLSYLKGKGVRIAQLTVDSENEVAKTLYRSVGFRITGTTLWYETVLN